MSCYEFSEINFNKNDCLFQMIDATYIIHLRNNGRYDNIIKQLNDYKPSSKLFILFNDGFKKCRKKEFITSSTYDLVDCNLTIFKHAIKHNFQNILILEDDFIFDSEIKKKHVRNRIDDFVKKYIDNNDFSIYYLGCTPILRKHFETHHTKLFISGTAHSVIFSLSFMKSIINKINKKEIVEKEIRDWDSFLYTGNYNRYAYKNPLCFQLFLKTENYDNWKSLFMIDIYIIKFLYSINNMDVSPTPGFQNFYYYSLLFYNFLCAMIIILIIIMLFYIFNKFYKKN